LRRIGLPEGKGFDSVFEVAAKRAMAHVRSEDFSGVYACHKELEVVSLFSEAFAALDENPDLEGKMIGVDVKGREVIANDCLCGGKSGEQKDRDPDGGRCADAVL